MDIMEKPPGNLFLCENYLEIKIRGLIFMWATGQGIGSNNGTARGQSCM